MQKAVSGGVFYIVEKYFPYRNIMWKVRCGIQRREYMEIRNDYKTDLGHIHL